MDSMTKASENELSALHSMLARKMRETLENSDTAVILLADFRDKLREIGATKIIDFLEAASTISPQLMQAIAKFLKDNEVTVQPDDPAQSDLAKRFAEKARRRDVSSVPLDDTIQ